MSGTSWAQYPPAAFEQALVIPSFVGELYADLPPPASETPDVEVPPTAEEELRNLFTPAYSIRSELRLDGSAMKEGGSAGIRVIVEGLRLGFDAGFSGIIVNAVDGSGAVVSKGLLDANFTVSPLTGERGRLRVEAGLGAIFLPCMSGAGPDLGVSGELRILGPFGVEGSVRTVPWPYRSLDWHAAVQMWLHHFDVRVGVRQVYIDDQGRVNGIRHTDSSFGPWVGVGLRM